MKEIQLSQGKVALVDDGDFEWLNQWKWHSIRKPNNRFYASRQTKITRTDKGQRQTMLLMHRFILSPDKRLVIDHKDGNGLNNQRNNIRVCTTAQNIQNRRKLPTNTLGLKGISIEVGNGRKTPAYKAGIMIEGTLHYLGCYKTPEEAAKVYDDAARKYHGEYACVNYPRLGERAA